MMALVSRPETIPSTAMVMAALRAWVLGYIL
jgi:hypothetical protein